MHGRVKSVEREKEQQKTDEQRQEELSKVRMYHEVAGKVLEMKRQKFYEPSVLPLTSHLLLLNPEFHVVWSYRRQVIDALVEKAEDPETEQQELAQTELKLTLDALQRNPKSYSAWFQRQWIIDRGLGDLKKEIGLCNKLLDLDERNFHCWNYRRHVCSMSEEDQLSFTTQKIEQNFSNYSALHHRTISLPDPLTADVLFDEIGLVQQAVFTEPDDQSAWFYYRWLVTSMVELVESSIEDATGFLKSQVQWLDELLEMESEAKWVIITLADLHSRLGSMDVEDSKKQSIDLYDRAIAVDPDHRRYYADMQKKNEDDVVSCQDYPGVELEQLNNYVVEFRPLVNPVFGDQLAFFIDEGRFIPYRMNVYGNAIVVNEIIWQVGNWSKLSGERGRTTASRGTFISGTDIRMPDVAYTPRDLHRDCSTESVWMYRGERYTPTFAVEVDKLSGPGSRLSTLDRKMRTEFFENGVQLGWLIDPRPDCHKMYEYYLDNDNQVQCSGNSEWRDLDGGDILPGFKLESIDLDMVLSQDSGSSSEEEVDFTCPERECGHQFNTRSKFIAHAQWHGAESARQRYLAKQNL